MRVFVTYYRECPVWFGFQLGVGTAAIIVYGPPWLRAAMVAGAVVVGVATASRPAYYDTSGRRRR